MAHAPSGRGGRPGDEGGRRLTDAGAVDAHRDRAAHGETLLGGLFLTHEHTRRGQIGEAARHERDVEEPGGRAGVDHRTRGRGTVDGADEDEPETCPRAHLGHLVEAVDELLTETQAPTVGGVDHVVAHEGAAHCGPDLLLDRRREHRGASDQCDADQHRRRGARRAARVPLHVATRHRARDPSYALHRCTEHPRDGAGQHRAQQEHRREQGTHAEREQYRVAPEHHPCDRRDTHASREWKFCSPAKMFGVGRPMNDRREPSVPPRITSRRGSMPAARVAAIVRRRATEAESGHLLRAGDLTLDSRSRRARAGDREIDLTKTEFDLLVAFMRAPDRAFDRDTLLDRVWGDWYSDAHVVDVTVARLRRKLADAGLPEVIDTVRGVGYRLSDVDGRATMAG